MKLLILILPALVLAGCSSISRNDCVQTNWYKVGYDGALQGKQASSVKQPWELSCTKNHGIKINGAEFNKGYSAGLDELCTEPGGMRLGRSGGTYERVCSKKTEPDFLKNYQLGKIEHTAARMSNLEDEVQDLRRQIRDRDSKIKDLESELSEAKRNKGF